MTSAKKMAAGAYLIDEGKVQSTKILTREPSAFPIRNGFKSALISPAAMQSEIFAHEELVNEGEWSKIEEYDWGTVKFGQLVDTVIITLNEEEKTLKMYNTIDIDFKPDFTPPSPKPIIPDVLESAYYSIITTHTTQSEMSSLVPVFRYLISEYGIVPELNAIGEIMESPMQNIVEVICTDSTFIAAIFDMFQVYESGSIETEYCMKKFDDGSIKVVPANQIYVGDMYIILQDYPQDQGNKIQFFTLQQFVENNPWWMFVNQTNAFSYVYGMELDKNHYPIVSYPEMIYENPNQQ